MRRLRRMGSEPNFGPIPQRPARRHGVDEEAESGSGPTRRSDGSTIRRIRYPMPDRLFAIGDIHGCSDALQDPHRGHRPPARGHHRRPGRRHRLGAGLEGIVQQLIDLSPPLPARPAPGQPRGDALRRPRIPDDLRYWLNFGGEETLSVIPLSGRRRVHRSRTHVRFLRGLPGLLRDRRLHFRARQLRPEQADVQAVEHTLPVGAVQPGVDAAALFGQDRHRRP